MSVPPYSPRATDEYERRQTEIGCEVCGRKPVRTARMEDHTRHVVCPMHGQVWGEFNPWPVDEAQWPTEFTYFETKDDLADELARLVGAAIQDIGANKVGNALIQELGTFIAITDLHPSETVHHGDVHITIERLDD